MYPGFSAITCREPAPWTDRMGWGAPFINSTIAEQKMCVRRMVANCHTITERISARVAAWNQSCRLPLSPCGLRFKLEPIYAVTKMDTVSFMKEVGNYYASSTPPHCSWQISGAKQSCVVQTALLQTQRPPSSRNEQIEPETCGSFRVTRYCFHNLTMNWAQTKTAKGSSRSNKAFQIRESNLSQETAPP